jgi:hypothetical protein
MLQPQPSGAVPNPQDQPISDDLASEAKGDASVEVVDAELVHKPALQRAVRVWRSRLQEVDVKQVAGMVAKAGPFIAVAAQLLLHRSWREDVVDETQRYGADGSVEYTRTARHKSNRTDVSMRPPRDPPL